ncbi:MAG: hypothetical protein CVU73_03925 [Deltaproteobacteria bacterium HGW-Deltaproteobacteria-8]|jgi:hypothetical protein|nr:MAG: hypothetical protein CVU73_03925 [Deltaproteobacteria bacterium HGW-Deltaproteobacteria-8]
MPNGAFIVGYELDESKTRTGLTILLAPVLPPAPPPQANVVDDHAIGVDLNKPMASDVPDDQVELKAEIERVLATIRALFPNYSQRFPRYLQTLYTVAQAGLTGQYAQTNVARRALLSLKEEIIGCEASRVKLRHLSSLGRWALILGAVTATCGMIFRYLAHLNWPVFIDFILLSQFAFAWSASMAGAFVSYGTRKTELSFEDLVKVERERNWFIVRLSYTGIQTMIVGLACVLNFTQVNIGNKSTLMFSYIVEIAVLVGLLCGFSEQMMSTAIAKQASALLGIPSEPQPSGPADHVGALNGNKPTNSPPAP